MCGANIDFTHRGTQIMLVCERVCTCPIPDGGGLSVLGNPDNVNRGCRRSEWYPHSTVLTNEVADGPYAGPGLA